MDMVKIAIDAGHGINTAGKRTPDGEREWSFNNKVVVAAIAKLKAFKGVEILRLDDPTGRIDVPLRTRTTKANQWGADVLVSVHHNAMTGRWGSHGGVETFTMDHPNANKKSVEIANVINPQIVRTMGLRNRGVKKMNLHMLRESNMPAILTEGGFMDSTTDIHVMRNDSKLRAQGVAIAEGLAKYYGLKSGGVVEQPSESVATVKPEPAPEPAPSKPKGKSVSQLASEVISGNHGSGHENRRKSLGISQAKYEKVRAEVNKRAGATTKPATKKSVAQMVQEVLEGKHGNGHDARRKSLGIGTVEYGKVSLEVNRRLSGGASNTKSINQMATEVIKGNHGSGHANRRKSLNISQSQYDKVRAEVNKRL